MLPDKSGLKFAMCFTELDKRYPFGIRLLLAFYTVIGRALQYIFTAIMVLIGFGVVLIRWEWLLRWGTVFWARGLFWILGKRVHIYGLKNIDVNKKYLLVTNHASLYDIPAIMACYPRISWLGRSYLIRIPVFGKFLERIDYIPIDPGDREKAWNALKKAIEKADKLTVAIFPEGTRTLNGEVNKFKRGFVYILKETGLDVLPVTMNGLFEFKPKNRFVIDPRPRIEIIFHSPIPNSELVELSDEEIIERVRSIILSAYKKPTIEVPVETNVRIE